MLIGAIKVSAMPGVQKIKPGFLSGLEKNNRGLEAPELKYATTVTKWSFCAKYVA
jgi:hypothetical protein